MATKDEVQEPKIESVEEARNRHNLALDRAVADKRARSRRHAQFLVNAGALKL